LWSGFLCEPSERLGKDIKALQAHPFFADLNWDDLHSKTPNFVPQTPDFLLDENSVENDVPPTEVARQPEPDTANPLNSDQLNDAMAKAVSRATEDKA